MRTKGEAAKAAKLAEQEYETQARGFKSEADATTKALTALQEEYRETLECLAVTILPTAEPMLVEQVAKASGRLNLTQQREQWTSRIPQIQTRIQEINSQTDFQNREELLDPQRGALGLQVERAKVQSQQAQTTHGPFLEEDFQWLIQRENKKQKGVSLFQGFLRAITFAELRERSSKKKLVAKFGVADWETLHQAYHDSLSRVDQTNQEFAQLSRRKETLDNLIAEDENLNQWVHNFEQRLAVELQSLLAVHLPHVDPIELKQVPGEHQVVASKAHAIREKLKYLGQLESYLQGEADERNLRASKINRVRRLWEQKPWDRVEGDKTKWLVTVPAMKKTSTQKRLRWSRSMRGGIVDYDDYDSYDTYYTYYDDRDDYNMLAYDVFAYGSDEPMPYEGFSGEVITDISEHRAEHGLEKADYSDFKAIDKEQLQAEAQGAPEAEQGESQDMGLDSDSDSDSDDAMAMAGATAIAAAAMAEETAMEAAMLAEEASIEEFADAS